MSSTSCRACLFEVYHFSTSGMAIACCTAIFGPPDHGRFYTQNFNAFRKLYLREWPLNDIPWHPISHSSELLIGQIISVHTLLRDQKRETATVVWSSPLPSNKEHQPRFIWRAILTHHMLIDLHRLHRHTQPGLALPPAICTLSLIDS